MNRTGRSVIRWSRFAVPSVFVLSSLVLAAGPLSAQWITFEDVSATRIVTDEGATDPVGVTDPFEKDLISADIDQDGDVDLIVARKVRFSVAGGKKNVLFMNEGGTMVDRTAELAPAMLDETDDRDVILVDVNGDGWLDMVTATTFSEQPRVYLSVIAVPGPEGGEVWSGFDYDPGAPHLPVFDPAPKFCAVVSGDVDNDGDEDLFFVDYSNDLEDRLLINDGNGFFTDETDTRMTAAMSQSAFGTDAQIVDVNMDGAADIVKLSTLGDSPNSVRVLYNAGGDDLGTFNFLQHVVTSSPYMMEVGDLNNDGRPDIYVVSDGQDRYAINTGNDAQGHVIWDERIVADSPVTESFGGNIKLADLDGNGYNDAVVADVDTDFQFCDRQPVILRNDGSTPTPNLTDPLGGAQPFWMPDGTFDFEVADFNGDGQLDLWAGTCNGNRLYFAPNPLFADNFESGTTDAWSSVGE